MGPGPLENAPSSSSTDSLEARFAAALPEGWSLVGAIISEGGRLVVRCRDAQGRDHAFDLRPRRPGDPSLLDREAIAYGYLAAPDAIIEGDLFASYRAVMEGFAAHEAEIISRISGTASTPAASSGGSGSIGPIDPLSPEWIAFECGLRPAIRVVLRSPEEGDALARAVHSRGSACFIPAELVRFGDDAQRVAYIARTMAEAEALANAEAPEVRDGVRIPDWSVEANTRVGELLGHPRCCVAALAARLERGATRCPDGSTAHADYAAAAWALRDTRKPRARLNNLLPDGSAPRLVTFFPCRYDCDAAGTYAAAVLALIASRAPELASHYRAALIGRAGIDRAGRKHPAGGDGADALWVDFAEF